MYNLDLKDNQTVGKGKFLFIELSQLIRERIIEFKYHNFASTND